MTTKIKEKMTILYKVLRRKQWFEDSGCYLVEQVNPKVLKSLKNLNIKEIAYLTLRSFNNAHPSYASDYEWIEKMAK